MATILERVMTTAVWPETHPHRGATAPGAVLVDLQPGDQPVEVPARSGGTGECPWGLDEVLARLAQVVAWTSPGGGWQENATFLLRTTDDDWCAVGFGEPAATALVQRLRELADFDTETLLRLIGESGRRMVTLWTRDATAS